MKKIDRGCQQKFTKGQNKHTDRYPNASVKTKNHEPSNFLPHSKINFLSTAI